MKIFFSIKNMSTWNFCLAFSLFSRRKLIPNFLPFCFSLIYIFSLILFYFDLHIFRNFYFHKKYKKKTVAKVFSGTKKVTKKQIIKKYFFCFFGVRGLGPQWPKKLKIFFFKYPMTKGWNQIVTLRLEKSARFIFLLFFFFHRYLLNILKSIKKYFAGFL